MSTEGFRLPRLEDVRYFVDENLMAIGSALMRLRKNTVVAGQDPIVDLVPRMDEEWIPVVAARRWVAITNDHAVTDVALERGRIVAPRARPGMVVAAAEWHPEDGLQAR